MPVTRSQKILDEDEGVSRQVPINAPSGHGSCNSRRSKSSLARDVMMKAQLDEQTLMQELELETTELEARRKRTLLKSHRNSEEARLTVAAEEEREGRPTDSSEVDKLSTISDYVKDFQSKWRPQEQLHFEYPAAKINERGENPFQPVIEGVELHKMELSSFDGDPRQY
ncbi:unnamed protein product [Echinostoma caproni]|uniref:AKAP2_C domain-containing protein n=1 Tax=Echinostoma caproni TaxID=27848 RepID=A0A183AQY9_9TREM|nr:unnamed protein product [Echinostoma caproni]